MTEIGEHPLAAPTEIRSTCIPILAPDVVHEHTRDRQPAQSFDSVQSPDERRSVVFIHRANLP